MYICTWGGPQNPPAHNALQYTSEGAWTGLEYPIAGLALLYGLTDTGLHMLRDARVKYDGTRRRCVWQNPFICLFWCCLLSISHSHTCSLLLTQSPLFLTIVVVYPHRQPLE